MVAVDVLTLHYDPELWGPEDPNEFCPLRLVILKRLKMSFEIIRFYY